jgi:SAM-dependent methyltransferase
VNALYDTIGKGYAGYRRPDPRIAAMIETALGDATTVINVGAGTGSYESSGRRVTAIEPSATMIAQRPPTAARAIQGTAEDIPFPGKSFDAATAFLTTHHWADLDKGLREMKRVARGPCVFLDHEMRDLKFWMLEDYFPDMIPRMKPLLALEAARAVFDTVSTVTVPVAHDCSDGFFCAYWRRPEAYLDVNVRAAISFFAIADDVDARIGRLRRDLDDGTWMRRHGDLLGKAEMDYGYRLVIAESGKV